MVPITTRPRYRVSEAVDIVAAAVIVTADKPASGRRNGCVAELVEIGVAASPAERGYLFRQQGQCIEGLALLPTFAIRPLCAW